MPFSASVICGVFFFHLIHIGKMFPFEDFFSFGETKNCSGQDWVNRECGAQGHAILVKNY